MYTLSQPLLSVRPELTLVFIPEGLKKVAGG